MGSALMVGPAPSISGSPEQLPDPLTRVHVVVGWFVSAKLPVNSTDASVALKETVKLRPHFASSLLLISLRFWKLLLPRHSISPVVSELGQVSVYLSPVANPVKVTFCRSLWPCSVARIGGRNSAVPVS